MCNVLWTGVMRMYNKTKIKTMRFGSSFSPPAARATGWMSSSFYRPIRSISCTCCRKGRATSTDKIHTHWTIHIRPWVVTPVTIEWSSLPLHKCTDFPDQSSQGCQSVQKELWSVWKRRKTEKEVIALLFKHEICWKYDEWLKRLPLLVYTLCQAWGHVDFADTQCILIPMEDISMWFADFCAE